MFIVENQLFGSFSANKFETNFCVFHSKFCGFYSLFCGFTPFFVVFLWMVFGYLLNWFCNHLDTTKASRLALWYPPKSPPTADRQEGCFKITYQYVKEPIRRQSGLVKAYGLPNLIQRYGDWGGFKFGFCHDTKSVL